MLWPLVLLQKTLKELGFRVHLPALNHGFNFRVPLPALNHGFNFRVHLPALNHGFNFRVHLPALNHGFNFRVHLPAKFARCKLAVVKLFLYVLKYGFRS